MSITVYLMGYIEVIPESEKGSGRKSVEIIVESIFDEIPTINVISILQLSKAINCNWRTTKKWLNLIWRIQRAPKISALRQEGGKLIVWQKERGHIPEKLIEVI